MQECRSINHAARCLKWSINQPDVDRKTPQHFSKRKDISIVEASQAFVFAMNLFHPRTARTATMAWILLELSGKSISEKNVLVLLPSITMAEEQNGTRHRGHVPLAEALGTVVTLAAQRLEKDLLPTDTGVNIYVYRSGGEPTWAIADTCKALMNSSESPVAVSADRTDHR